MALSLPRPSRITDVRQRSDRQPRRDRAASSNAARWAASGRWWSRSGCGRQVCEALADESGLHRPAPSAQSYLNVPAIIAAAGVTDTVIHRLRFLSGTPISRRKVEAGFVISPRRASASWATRYRPSGYVKAGSCGTGSDGALDDPHEPEDRPHRQLSVIIKASGGGGGRGMRVVHTEAALVINAICDNPPRVGGAGVR